MEQIQKRLPPPMRALHQELEDLRAAHAKKCAELEAENARLGTELAAAKAEIMRLSAPPTEPPPPETER